MEILLEQEMVDEYVRLYNFMDDSKEEPLWNFAFMRREIAFLKREIRYIYTHEERSNDEVNQSKFDAFFETHTKINREIMHNAKSLSDCIEACKNTPYSEPLQRAENVTARIHFRWVWCWTHITISQYGIQHRSLLIRHRRIYLKGLSEQK